MTHVTIHSTNLENIAVGSLQTKWSERSDYDGLFEKSYLLQYDRVRKLMKLAYNLPSMDVLPSTKAVKFVKATGELKESFISDRDKKANFESVSYQVCLRTIHELFEADEAGGPGVLLRHRPRAR